MSSSVSTAVESLCDIVFRPLLKSTEQTTVNPVSAIDLTTFSVSLSALKLHQRGPSCRGALLKSNSMYVCIYVYKYVCVFLCMCV